MKKIILFFILSGYIFAQAGDYSKLYPIGIGASIYAKAGTNAVVQEQNRETSFAIQNIPDFYLNAYLPYSIDKNIGLYLETGLNNNGHKFSFFQPDLTFTTRVSYFSIAPYLYLEGFLFGINYGVPLFVDYGESGENEFTGSSDLDRLNNVFEIRFGGTYNFYRDQSGRLAINFMMSYNLNGLFKDYFNNEPYQQIVPQDSDYPLIESSNPRIANINIGLLYFFNINQ